MTLFIAIWGAVLATASFIWNFWKWHQESPKIVATIETVKSFLSEDKFAGIRLTLRNRGGVKTTVENIFLHQRQNWFGDGLNGFLFRLNRILPWQQNVGISNPKTARTPVVLDVNELWEGFIPLEANEPDDEEELRQTDRNRAILKSLRSGEELRYSIQCAHSNRRIRGVVKNEDLWSKE